MTRDPLTDPQPGDVVRARPMKYPQRREAVLSALRGGSETAEDVATVVGLSYHTVSDYLRWLVRRGEAVRFAPKRYRVVP